MTEQRFACSVSRSHSPGKDQDSMITDSRVTVSGMMNDEPLRRKQDIDSTSSLAGDERLFSSVELRSLCGF